MIDVHSPQQTIRNIDSGIVPKYGSVTIFSGIMMIVTSSAIASDAQKRSCEREETLPATQPPMKRPIIMKNQ